jgi:hypothetical protein
MYTRTTSFTLETFSDNVARYHKYVNISLIVRLHSFWHHILEKIFLLVHLYQ